MLFRHLPRGGEGRSRDGWPARSLRPDDKGGNAPDGRKVRGTIPLGVGRPCAPRRDPPLPPAVHPPGSRARTATHGRPQPHSLEVLSGAMVEPGLAGKQFRRGVQFERQGYSSRPDAGPTGSSSTHARRCADSWAKAQGSSGR